MKGSVGIVGAGFGGLAAASLLAAEGYRVDILEKNSGPGGKAGSFRLGEYRFDSGPSFFSMPHVFEYLFEACGEALSSYLDLIPLEKVTNYYFNDGTLITSRSSIEKFAEEISQNTSDSFESLRDYLTLCSRISSAVEPVFLWKDPREKGLLFSPQGRKALLEIPITAFISSMDSMTRNYLKDEKSIRIFDRYATFNGSNPFRARGIFNLIASLELGAKTPKGGIIAVTKALESLAVKKGVQIRYNTAVERVLTRKGSVQGIEAAGIRKSYDHVILNTDIRYAYEKLLTDKKSSLMKRYRRRQPSTSGIVFYWGINRSFDALGLHNILFTDDYPGEFKLLFSKDGSEISSDPTIYINITSKIDTGDAPEGTENWFVLVNAPFDRGQDWSRLTALLRNSVIKKCSRLLGTDIESCIVEERILTPPDIERETGSYHGSLYGLSSNRWNSAFLRPQNRSSEYSNLYFCGGTVHPGGGMPLAILSGRQAAMEVIKNGA